jgi:hypothetical protein
VKLVVEGADQCWSSGANYAFSRRDSRRGGERETYDL